jgi:2-keto-myo-inositol isomerase
MPGELRMSDPHAHESLHRRAMLARTALGTGAALLASPAGAVAAVPVRPQEPFGYCLNTGTIRSGETTLAERVQVAAKAGYQGIELWMSEIKQYVEKGGSPAALKKLVADAGLVVPNVITFSSWMVDDDAKRTAAMEQYKVEMGLLAEIGIKRIAAPPSGGRDQVVDLAAVAERYRTVLELGRKMGVTPIVEIWGPVKTLSRLSHAAFVAVEAGHPDASPLLDAYQIYRGGSSFDGLRMFNGAAMHVFHINDYPADPPRESLTDAHRVYPGDGVAPMGDLLRTLADIGFRGMLSLELFNREYWKNPPLAIAQTGLAKMRAAVQKAMAGK